MAYNCQGCETNFINDLLHWLQLIKNNYRHKENIQEVGIWQQCVYPMQSSNYKYPINLWQDYILHAYRYVHVRTFPLAGAPETTLQQIEKM